MSIKMGDPEDFTNFVNAVIDESAFKSIIEYIDFANAGERCRDPDRREVRQVQRVLHRADRGGYHQSAFQTAAKKKSSAR